MNWLNGIISIFFIGLSIIICLESLKLGIGQLRDPGPGFMPFFTSCLLFLLSMAVFIKDFFIIGLNESKGEKSAVVQRNFRKPISLVLILSANIFLLNSLGYLIATFLLMFFMLFIFDPSLKKFLMYFIVAAIGANVTFLIFSKFLQIQFPAGIIQY